MENFSGKISRNDFILIDTHFLGYDALTMKEDYKVPQNVLKEISLYMSPGEKVLDAILSASGPVGKIGEIWMILTDLTVLFHTKEYGKDPVVALISRKDLQMVKYDHHPNGTTLVFVPSSRPRNTIKVPFPKNQRVHVNRFCEELSKTIPFELVGENDKRILESPPEPQPEIKAKSTVVKPPAPPSSGPPASLRKTEPPKKEVVPEPPKSVQNPIVPPPPIETKPAGLPADSSVKVVKEASPQPEIVEVSDEPFNLVKFAFLSTVIALLVTFLWFQLFSRASDESEWN